MVYLKMAIKFIFTRFFTIFAQFCIFIMQFCNYDTSKRLRVSQRPPLTAGIMTRVDAYFRGRDYFTALNDISRPLTECVRAPNEMKSTPACA